MAARPRISSSTQKTVPHPPLPVDGNGSFNNLALAVLVVIAPLVLVKCIPFLSLGFYSYLFLLIPGGLAVTVAYWQIMSMYGAHVRHNIKLPGRPLSDYLTINDPELKKEYHDGTKIPMQIAYDAYFDKKLDFNGDVLETLEYRHDWATFRFTTEIWKFLFTGFFPDVIQHTRDQDETQIRDNYDRGTDFYYYFLGPRMIYTSGVISDPRVNESLEELQDNKLALVCHKLDLKPEDRLLDIGCGWGTLITYAAKNFGCDVTGLTLAKTGADFGNERIRANGVSPEKARIRCMDYRDMPKDQQFTKIVSLEMAEHVGVLKYSRFLQQIYDMLDDNGTFVFQVAGLRPSWQYEDLVWGLFMNKYIFPAGADASCSLGWVINKLEAAGFEVQNVDVLGVHYSATIWRWYQNWLANKDKIIARYGERLYRIWVYFLASSVIVARQGGSSLFQITLHKNLNQFHRIEGQPSHSSLHIGRKEGVQLIDARQDFEGHGKS